jgi:hypothetical protein
VLAFLASLGLKALDVWQRVPRRVLAVLFGGLALLLVVWLASRAFHRAQDDAKEAGKREVREAANVMIEAARGMTIIAERNLRHAQARVDTVVVTVGNRTSAIRGVASRVPDTVRVRFPVTDTLVIESVRLTHAVDTLRAAVQTERGASRDLHQLDTATIAAQAVVIGHRTAERDTARAESRRRVSKRTAGIVALGLGAVGFLAGRR